MNPIKHLIDAVVVVTLCVLTAFPVRAEAVRTGTTAVTPRVSVGWAHTVALKADSSLWTWGYNSSGQLGDGTMTDRLVPKQIGTGYAAIAVGKSHYTVALKTDGSLWAWGDNASGQLGDGTTAGSLVPKQIGTGSYTAVAAGGSHTVALKADGSLWAWGDDNSAYNANDSLIPKQIGTDSYTAIAAGWSHTVALKTDGSLFTWGKNLSGQLGDGTTTDRAVPVQIGTGSYTAIAAGFQSTFALVADGTLWGWGYIGDYGYLGDGSRGYLDGEGFLGDGTRSGSLVPKQIGTGKYSAISTANNYSFALEADGSLWAWGANFYGQLGDGTNIYSLVPRYIINLADTIAPSAPSGLNAVSVGANQVKLIWSASVDSSGVVDYQIYRNGVYIGTTTVTSYGDIGLTASTSYSYTV